LRKTAEYEGENRAPLHYAFRPAGVPPMDRQELYRFRGYLQTLEIKQFRELYEEKHCRV
jgi:hypothetical protein